MMKSEKKTVTSINKTLLTIQIRYGMWLATKLVCRNENSNNKLHRSLSETIGSHTILG